jgi:hypothetical protein
LAGTEELKVQLDIGDRLQNLEIMQNSLASGPSKESINLKNSKINSLLDSSRVSDIKSDPRFNYGGLSELIDFERLRLSTEQGPAGGATTLNNASVATSNKNTGSLFLMLFESDLQTAREETFEQLTSARDVR